MQLPYPRPGRDRARSAWCASGASGRTRTYQRPGAGVWGCTVDNIDDALEIAARHGCHPLRGVATYEDVYKLTYVRGPSGILVMLAEELQKS